MIFSLLYAFKRKLGNKKISLSNALKDEGIKLEGTAHRGVWDAYNTGKLLLKMFN